MIPTQSPITTLPEVLYEALKAKPRTRRDLERAAALKGFAAVQVEVALSKAEKLGLFAKEPMYRLVEDEQPPDSKPALIGMDFGKPGADRTVVTFAPMEAGARRRAKYWPTVYERIKALGVGDSCVLGRRIGDTGFGTVISVYLTQWRKKGRLSGRYEQHSFLDRVTITRVA